jgi:hypothetical protein
MRNFLRLLRNDDAAAAAEMVFVMPMLVILMFGSMELGNLFLTEHAVTKQVRDGARYASRLTLDGDYSCAPGDDLSTIFEDAEAGEKIVNVTQTGSVDGTGTARFPAEFWDACATGDPVKVTIRCVDKDDYAGIYTGLDGDIPVVTVSANVTYPSLFSTLGFNTTGMCVRASSEVAVAGL